MDRVREELADAKAEIEKLKTESRVKVDQFDSLRKAHNETLIKTQETNWKLEKQAQELNIKADELSVAKQMCEDLKCSMKQKEAVIQRLSSTNDKLRSDFNEKLQKCQEENRELVFKLDETNSKNMDQEKKIRLLKVEIEDLKEGLISVSQKKCNEEDKMAKKSKELRQRDDVLQKVEEENEKLEAQLKWKKEHFKHLEEAHEKLRDHLRSKEREWEMEKTAVLDEISNMQAKLDSQTGTSEDLQKRLKMCNQALAQEESRRKLLEARLSESKIHTGSVFAECEEAKSKLECLTGERDKEIATLRDMMGTKETLYKEMDYKVKKLEQENQELKFSLKELQEEQIHQAGSQYSMSKIQKKLKSLEQIHGNCSKHLKEKEAEWSSRLDSVNEDLNRCRFQLESKEASLKELKMELEGSYSSIMDLALKNEESSLMLLVLKAQLKLAGEKGEMEIKNRGREENVKEELKNCRFELERKDDVIKELRMKLESSYSLITQLKLQNEQSSLMILVLKSRFTEAQLNHVDEKNEMELKNKDREENVKGDLNQYRIDLESKDAVINELRMELESSDSLIMQLTLLNVESSVMLLVLKSIFKEAQSKLADEKDEMDRTNTEREYSVPDIGAERDNVALLQEELGRHKKMLSESSACELSLKEQVLQLEFDLEKAYDALDRVDEELDEKSQEVTQVQYELQIWESTAERLKADLEENLIMRRAIEASLLEEVNVEVTLKEEKQSLVQKLVLLEKELKEREAVTDEKGNEWVRKELEGAILAQMDAEIIHNHEKEQLAAELSAKELEVKKLMDQVMKLSSERESLMGVIGELSERMRKFSSEDIELMGMLRKIVQNFDESKVGLELEEDDELFDAVKENANIAPSPLEKKIETSLDKRSPLRALNS